MTAPKEVLEVMQAIASIRLHRGWQELRKRVEATITSENKQLVSYGSTDPAMIYRLQGSIHALSAVLKVMDDAVEICEQAKAKK
jgi:hypothetical protein